MEKQILDCEKQTYLRKVKECYMENGMLYQFLKFLERLQKKATKKR